MTIQLQELFEDFSEFSEKEEAVAFLAYWCDLAEESKIRPMIEICSNHSNPLERHNKLYTP